MFFGGEITNNKIPDRPLKSVGVLFVLFKKLELVN